MATELSLTIIEVDDVVLTKKMEQVVDRGGAHIVPVGVIGSAKCDVCEV